MAKLFDLVVVTGAYNAPDGSQKRRWATVGAIVKAKNDAGMVVVLDRTFSPAGVPTEDGRSQITLFPVEPRGRDRQQRQEDIPTPPKGQGMKAMDGLEDDLPF